MSLIWLSVNKNVKGKTQTSTQVCTGVLRGYSVGTKPLFSNYEYITEISLQGRSFEPVWTGYLTCIPEEKKKDNLVKKEREKEGNIS